MIPYALLMLNFIWKDRHLEVRALDPIEHGVSFRVAAKRKKDMEERPIQVECLFLDYSQTAYDKVKLEGDFSIRLLEKEGDAGGILYALESENADFLQALQKLLGDYMTYIRLHTEGEELEAQEAMTGIGLSGHYPASLEEWQKGQNLEAKRPYRLNSVELAICLDQADLWEKFSTMDREEFLTFYWKENGLSKHPISCIPVSHIYIGNSYCPLLFPDAQTLELILEKGVKDKLVFVLSTMPQHLAEEYKRRLSQILTWAKESGQRPELVVNDLGTILLLEEEERKKVDLILGPLYCKRPKDARYGWSFRGREESAFFGKKVQSTSIDDAFYREYFMQRFGICRFTYEACGYPIEVKGSGNVLQLPLYQTNTSGTCTLYALCKNGNRQNQEPVLNCPRYCQNHQVFYPANCNAIGRWNSLFGCSTEELNDPDILNHYLEAGISRLVVRM